MVLPSGPSPSRHWTMAAISLPFGLVACVVYALVEAEADACEQRYGDRILDVAECRGPALLLFVAVIAIVVLVFAPVVIGPFVGVVEGRRRRRFGHGRWGAVIVVGLTAAWALAAYAIGYGLGRILPERELPPDEVRMVGRLQSWRDALGLYVRLVDGGPPPVTPTPPFLGKHPVHLDATFGYARFYSTTASHSGGAVVAVGSRALMAGALIGTVVGNAMARSRARRIAQAQWREHTTVRVVVTATTTWCCVEGKWLHFDHTAVADYAIDPQGPAVVMTFVGVAPLRLTGPEAWYHAVLFAYFRYGQQALQQTPFLHPLAAESREHVPVAPPPPGSATRRR
jgi:hypothetical protein